MPKISVYDLTGKATGEEIELNDSVFGVEFNEPVVHQAIVMQAANERQGTSATKTRAMVRGGGRKPWKQKGTGHARSGSNRSPVWVGGGVTFGPQPRSYAKDMNRKARRLAIRCALSAKVAAGELVVIDNITFSEPRTKNVAALLSAFETGETKTLIITNGENENVLLSARNMPKVTTITNKGLNCFDLLNNHKVFLDKNAVESIEEVLA